jgi:hypothetical protein
VLWSFLFPIATIIVIIINNNISAAIIFCQSFCLNSLPLLSPSSFTIAMQSLLFLLAALSLLSLHHHHCYNQCHFASTIVTSIIITNVIPTIIAIGIAITIIIITTTMLLTV